MDNLRTKKKWKINLIWISVLVVCSMLFSNFITRELTWQVAKGPLMTKWAEGISPSNAHAEYPRPQMVRAEWMNLNGLWDYAICPKSEGSPDQYDGQILVPFPIESALSGVMKPVGETNKVWYRRTFQVPPDWADRQIMLNFGAVDWEASIWINGSEVGNHRGGYDAFCFDITEALHPTGIQEIVVSVWDPVDSGTQPHGKQVREPRGIWYTSVTGIWQTVWIEAVNKTHITSMQIIPDVDTEQVRLNVNCTKAFKDMVIQAEVIEENSTLNIVKGELNKTLIIPIKDPKLWSPDTPFLYDLKIDIYDQNGKSIDRVASYFGMRKISLGQDKDGITKLFLNNKELFHFGPLDQGWWPDGLYTAPSDAALRYDIEVTKQLGFNMARKHVKIEPARWYYWCDKLGLLVWQDMPSGDAYIGHNDPDIKRSVASANQFKWELRRLIEYFGNHPSIVMWIPYNEGWGQYDTPGIVKFIKELDGTRLVNNASGWADRSVGDVHDIHAYPGPAMPPLETDRAAVLGEFGGLGLPLEGHTWQDEKNWGYRKYDTVETLTEAYKNLIKELYVLIQRGLAAAVYTQTSDVEIEVNGLMTYDRRVIKIAPEKISRINQGYIPPLITSRYEIFLDQANIEIKNMGQSGEIRYTLDGSEPSLSSSVYYKPLVLRETTDIKAKTYWPDKKSSVTTKFTIKKVSLRQPTAVQKAEPGLIYSYYENDRERWTKLPDFKLLSPLKSGILNSYDLTPAKRSDDFGMQFEGYINILKDGIYKFYVESDDGTKLYIDSQVLVDNDFTHGMSEKGGVIALKSGMFPIKVEFFQGMGGKGLAVRYEGPGMEKQSISENVLFH
jgi:hypothetical protein